MRLTLGLCGALVLGLASAPAHAQTVQSTLSLSLTVQLSIPAGNGSRIASFRLGTRDLVEAAKEDLSVTGPGGMLVVRRPIGNLDDPGETFLIVGNQEYPLPDSPIDEIDVDLPASFFAEVEAVKLRKSDGSESAITLIQPGAFSAGDLAQDDFEMTLVGLGRVSLKLLTQNGVDLGYLVLSNSADVMGGMQVNIPGSGVEDAVVSGTLRFGPERIVP